MQLIALVYKDQHVHKLERLLNDWLETSLSESSEDNESNTSPQDQVKPFFSTGQSVHCRIQSYDHERQGLARFKNKTKKNICENTLAY
jgi:hypothetical protein